MRPKTLFIFYDMTTRAYAYSCGIECEFVDRYENKRGGGGGIAYSMEQNEAGAH